MCWRALSCGGGERGREGGREARLDGVGGEVAAAVRLGSYLCPLLAPLLSVPLTLSHHPGVALEVVSHVAVG